MPISVFVSLSLILNSDPSLISLSQSDYFLYLSLATFEEVIKISPILSMSLTEIKNGFKSLGCSFFLFSILTLNLFSLKTVREFVHLLHLLFYKENTLYRLREWFTARRDFHVTISIDFILYSINAIQVLLGESYLSKTWKFLLYLFLSSHLIINLIDLVCLLKYWTCFIF